jgi:dihydroorotase
MGAIALTDPPLRSRETMGKIQVATFNGLVDIVASDHAPHTLDEKNRANVWEIPPGFPGLETTLPLLLTSLNRGNISLQDVAELLAENPSKIFNLKFKGKIQTGYDADLTVIDLKRDYKIDSSKFHSKAKYSPFENLNVKGKAVKTFVAGVLVIDDDEVLAKPGLGKILKEC